MIAMIVVNGWDFNQMRHIMLALCIVPNLVTIAHSASKLTIKRDDDKTVSIVTRELRTNVLDVMTHRLTNPAPPNNCARPAFEILNNRADEPRCVNLR